MKGRTYTFTTSDEAKARRIAERLRAEGVRVELKQTQPRTFVVEDEAVTLGSARPWNITVASRHQATLERIVRVDKSGAEAAGAEG